MELLTTILLALLAPPVYYFYLIYRNYLKARKLGIPIVFLPVGPANPIWFIISPKLHQLLSRIGLGRLTRLTHLGWDIHEKAQPFIEMGTTAFVHVSPSGLWVNLADPKAVSQLYVAERKGIYERPYEGIKMLEVFGPNLSTAGAKDWQRMKRVTASSFSETTMRTVWAETLKQAQSALRMWLAKGEDGVTTTAEDTTTLALNVMLKAGFGKGYDFEVAKKEEADVQSGGAMDYRQAIKLVLENAIAIIAIGPKNLDAASRIFTGFKVVREAVATFQGYMTDMLNEEKEGQEPAQRGNLLAQLVRASHENTLSQREVFGNMFVFTFGGHDTTAHSLAFTFVLLSIRPEIQAWMREELRAVLKSSNPEDWSYDDYSKLKRVLAVQYETIRLFNPVLGIVKGNCSGHPQELSLEDGKKMVLPDKTDITILTNSIHSHPKYWGEDALEWKPKRWIRNDGKSGDQMITPETGTFLAWGDGVRSCPGRKFGHIEHTAIMAAAFYDHTVEAAPEKGETPQQTRARINDIIRDRGMTLTVHMWHPERARLIWKRHP